MRILELAHRFEKEYLQCTNPADPGKKALCDAKINEIRKQSYLLYLHERVKVCLPWF